MGVAAYNRGSKRISESVDDSLRSTEMQLLDDLSTYSDSVHAAALWPARLFAETVLRIGPKPGEVSLMNRQAKGWAEYAQTFKSPWDAAKAYHLTFIGLGEDEYGKFFRVV